MRILTALCLFLVTLPAVACLEEGSSGVGTISEAELRTYLFDLAADDMQGRLPGTEGWLRAGTYVEKQLRRLGVQPMLTDEEGNPTYRQPFVAERGEYRAATWNVVALVPGTDPAVANQFVTMGVHLDHIGAADGVVFNGADDNAASCAVLLEIAEAFVTAPPRRPVILIWYSAEEMGLDGSRHFVRNPPVPVEQMIININMEMIGRRSAENPGGFTMIGAEALRPELPQIIETINSTSLDLPLAYLPVAEDTAGFFRRSDHYNFHLAGVPALVFGGSMHGDYHQPTDDPELIDMEKVHLAARLTWALAEHFANADDPWRSQ